MLRSLAAAVTFIVFFAVGRWIVPWLFFRAKHVEAGFLEKLSAAISLLLYVLGIITAISVLSLSYAVLEVVVILIILAFIVAFRDLLANAVGEVYLRFRLPFTPGEWVKIGDIEGRILSINTFDVELATREGDKVLVPNSQFLRSIIVRRVGVARSVLEVTLIIKGITAKDVDKVVRSALQAVRPELYGEGEVREVKRNKEFTRVILALPLINVLKGEKLASELAGHIREKGYEVEIA